ncbi:MAG: BACON domain-containing protein [Bacteroidales bacterium]|nr:BACON domain-containing protein [Bacteroidales bacterium]
MKIINKVLAVFAFAAAAVACAPNEVTPTPTTPSAKFVKKSISVSRVGGTQTVSLNANCDWTVTNDYEWVKISPLSGTSATKDITITVAENPAEINRIASIFLQGAGAAKADTLVLTQKAAGGFDGHIKDAESFFDFLEEVPNLGESDVIELDADVNLGGEAITPIISFVSVLKGNNHSIYNFTITSSNSTSGLILSNSGTISDLIIGTADGKKWDGTTKINFADEIVGSAAGIIAVNSGTVENVTNFASIDFNASTDANDGCVGGVVGSIGTPTAVLKNCHNYGAVTFTGTMGARACIGGVLGFTSQAGAVVEGCQNHASINQATVNAKEFTIGGVIGRANTKVTAIECKNDGNVSYTYSGKPGTYIHIAGILGAGYSGCELINCENTGEVSSCILQVNRIGGIAGTINTGGKISGCVNKGAITIAQQANDNWQGIGGICGFEEKASETSPFVIENSINEGLISIDITNATTHNNKAAAAGIIGSSCSYIEVYGCTNKGNVVGKNAASGLLYTGGICGLYRGGNPSCNFHDNVNEGDVTLTATDGAAGGVVGNCAVAASQIKSCTNTGKITFSLASATGSIAGLATPSLNSCAVGGTVNDTEVTASNFATYIQGSASTGVPVGCYFVGGSAADYVSATPATIGIIAAGESKDINVDANCEWTATSSEAWLTLSVATGEGAATVTVTAAENTEKTPRTATVEFVSKKDATAKATVTVNQAEHIDGLKDNKITSAADFKVFLALAADAAETDTYTLEADVDLTGVTITPAPSFAGTLDGQNHKISNIVVSSDGKAVGLIESLTGEVKNLVIGSADGSTYDGTSKFVTAYNASDAYAYVGAVAAKVSGGKVTNVVNYASCGVDSGANGTRIGGLTGYAIGATFTNCKNYGTVYNTNASMASTSYLAGIASWLDTTPSTFTSCENHGDITSTSGKVLRIGGISSENRVDGVVFDQCKNYGTIHHEPNPVDGSNWAAIAGICGQSNGNATTIQACENRGSITSKNHKQVVRLGGMIGTIHTSVKVLGCTNYGDLSLIYDQETAIANWEAVGGMAGICENKTGEEIKNNVNEGNIYLKVNSNVSHANHVAAAGIVAVPGNGAFEGNINRGSVYCENTATEKGSAIAGGVIGLIIRTTHTGEENYGDVTAVSASEALNSSTAAGNTIVAAGGLYGVNSMASPINGKSKGAVSATSASGTPAAGGLVGWQAASSEVSGSYAGSVNGVTVTTANLTDLVVGKNAGTVGTVTLLP